MIKIKGDFDKMGKIIAITNQKGGVGKTSVTSNLGISLAKNNKVNYVVDIFPYYGSDIGAAWRSGVDCAGALIGPGVHASHGMERTHLDAIDNTIKLLFAYLTNK